MTRRVEREPYCKWLRKVGSPGRPRTCDILINSQALYRLSYRGTHRKYYTVCRLVATFEALAALALSLALSAARAASSRSAHARSPRGRKSALWARVVVGVARKALAAASLIGVS